MELLGDIDWQSETSGFVQCPGKHLHTTGDGERDCKIDFDHVPTIHCFHDHCRGILEGINHELRSRIGKAEHVKLGEAPQWGEPQPLPEDMPAVPPFDYQCLPETFEPWIRDIAERMQCPPDFPAVGAMIALGSVLGRKIGIRPKRRDDWVEIANLWGCIIARPGLLKTPALQQALVLLRRLVAKAYEKYKEACQEHDISDMLRAQRKKIVEDQIRNALKESRKKRTRPKKSRPKKLRVKWQRSILRRRTRNRFAAVTKSTIQQSRSSANCWRKIPTGCFLSAMSFPVFCVNSIRRSTRATGRRIWKCGTAREN